MCPADGAPPGVGRFQGGPGKANLRRGAARAPVEVARTRSLARPASGVTFVTTHVCLATDRRGPNTTAAACGTLRGGPNRQSPVVRASLGTSGGGSGVLRCGGHREAWRTSRLSPSPQPRQNDGTLCSSVANQWLRLCTQARSCVPPALFGVILQTAPDCFGCVVCGPGGPPEGGGFIPPKVVVLSP